MTIRAGAYRTIFVVSVSLLMFAVPGTRAQASTGLTIQPIKISQTMKPGDSAKGDILLSNASAEDVAVDISVQDFVPTSGTETFQFVGRAPGVTSVRDWVTIDSPLHFTFKQGEARHIPYTIKAPADAEPGSHFGVIFFKATNVSDLNAQIRVGTQVGVLTFVTIPGKFEQKGSIRSLTAPSFVQRGPVLLDLNFENTGTVYFEPKGNIDITNMFGSKIASIPIEGYAVLPTGVKDMKIPWNVSGFILGRYTATASIFDTDGNLLTSKSISFFALPVWYIVAFIAVFIALFLLIRFIKRKVSFKISIKE